MVLCIDLQGYQSTFAHRLPPAESVPLFVEFDSLYRLLEKGTAADPDDRFQTAEEMADQLVGVLREIVARLAAPPTRGPARCSAATSARDPDRPDYRRLPVLRVNGDDPAAGYLATLAASAPADLVRLLRGAPDQSVEVRLRLARELIDAGEWDDASATLDAIADDDAWEWRVAWLRGIAELARGRPAQARRGSTRSTARSPASWHRSWRWPSRRVRGRSRGGAPAYEIVSRIDPSFTTAAFGLARCLPRPRRSRRRAGAYERVQESSSTFTESRSGDDPLPDRRRGRGEPTVADLVKADAILQAVDVDPEQQLAADRRGARARDRPAGRAPGCLTAGRARGGLRAGGPGPAHRARGGLPRARAPCARRGRGASGSSTSPTRCARGRGRERLERTALRRLRRAARRGRPLLRGVRRPPVDEPAEDEHVPDGRSSWTSAPRPRSATRAACTTATRTPSTSSSSGTRSSPSSATGSPPRRRRRRGADRGAGRGRGARGRDPRRRRRSGRPCAAAIAAANAAVGEVPGDRAPTARVPVLHAGLRGVP